MCFLGNYFFWTKTYDKEMWVLFWGLRKGLPKSPYYSLKFIIIFSVTCDIKLTQIEEF